jgi:uncharacterized protein YjbJ (UPF0337 family)
MTTRTDKVAGHAKEVAGIVTNDKDLEKKGTTQRKTAETKAAVDDAQNRLVRVIDKGQQFVNTGFDKMKSLVGGK